MVPRCSGSRSPEENNSTSNELPHYYRLNLFSTFLVRVKVGFCFGIEIALQPSRFAWLCCTREREGYWNENFLASFDNDLDAKKGLFCATTHIFVRLRRITMRSLREPRFGQGYRTPNDVSIHELISLLQCGHVGFSTYVRD